MINFKPSPEQTEKYQARLNNLISRLEAAASTIDNLVSDAEDEFLAIDEDALATIDVYYKKLGSCIWNLNIQKYRIKEVHRSPNRLLSLRTDTAVSAPQKPQEEASAAPQAPSGTDALWAAWMPQAADAERWPISDI